jgi:transposase
MLLPFNAEIYFYRKPVSFRYQIDGLMRLIADTLQMNPTSGQIFIFRNKGKDRLKILYYERNGFWLLYRRLESGRFKYPEEDEIAMPLTVDQFQWLLSGLDVMAHTPQKEVKYEHFF